MKGKETCTRKTHNRISFIQTKFGKYIAWSEVNVQNINIVVSSIETKNFQDRRNHLDLLVNK